MLDDLVLEQAVVEQREPDVVGRSVDEPSRDERRQAVLVGATFRGEAAVHDGEGAFGVGPAHGRREGEVRPQPVVAHVVVELHVHAQEALAGAQLEGGDDVDGPQVVAAPGAQPFVADRGGGPPVGAGDHQSARVPDPTPPP